VQAGLADLRHVLAVRRGRGFVPAPWEAKPWLILAHKQAMLKAFFCPCRDHCSVTINTLLPLKQGTAPTHFFLLKFFCMSFYHDLS
jgi:hypothetical protein